MVKAIFGNKLVPSYADHYLAKQGYEAQQYDGPRDPNQPDNLYEPIPGDHGSHGAFNARAKTWSAEAWAEQHQRLVGLTLLGIGAAGAIGAAMWRSRRS